MISDKRKIIFLHLPKCGGTSIEHILNTIPDFKKLKDNIYSKGDTLWSSLLEHDPSLKDKIKTYTVFTSVRHPVSRFISAYNDFIYTRIDPKFEGNINTLTISNVLQHPRMVKNVYLRLYYHLLIPLVEHLPPLKYVNHIIKLENFESELRTLFRLLGLPCPNCIPHRNKSKKVLTHIDGYAIQKIKNRFKKDYAAGFGYI